MNLILYTKSDKNPRPLIEIRSDLALLSACVRDGEIKPAEIMDMLKRAMEKINDAVLHGKNLAKDQ
jgi:hypothetical protein